MTSPTASDNAEVDDTEVLRYRGRVVGAPDLAFIRTLIADRPGASRRALSLELCAAWRWVQHNGAPCDAVARSLLLQLHRDGHIELPAARYVPPQPAHHRARPEPIEIDRTPIRARLRDLRPLEFVRVRRTDREPIFNALIEMHHYLGYTQPVGAHLKYLVYGRKSDRPLACLSWSSAPRHLGARDRFIGWSPEERRRNIRFVAYNPRFLILPWVEVPYLASHLLGRMAKQLPEDWEEAYGYPVRFLETFVDPTRYRGTCYRAANWIVLGRTTGRGKNSPSWAPNRSIKEVLGYPLTPDFREELSRVE
jgi:hypothetical protein